MNYEPWTPGQFYPPPGSPDRPLSDISPTAVVNVGAPGSRPSSAAIYGNEGEEPAPPPLMSRPVLGSRFTVRQVTGGAMLLTAAALLARALHESPTGFANARPNYHGGCGCGG